MDVDGFTSFGADSLARYMDATLAETWPLHYATGVEHGLSSFMDYEAQFGRLDCALSESRSSAAASDIDSAIDSLKVVKHEFRKLRSHGLPLSALKNRIHVYRSIKSQFRRMRHL